MSTKLIQTKEYLLLIDEEVEIKGSSELSFYKNNHGSEKLCISYLSKTGIVFHELDVDPVEEYGSIECGLTPLKENVSKIIAYYPLSKEAKELDLPLLPRPVNNCNPFLNGKITKATCYTDSGTFYFEDLERLFKSKQFSLEDMYRVAIAVANKVSRPEYGEIININEIVDTYIQSLSTQQLPKEFIPEYDLMNEGYNKPEDYPYQECKVLKTITNSEGKEELVGTYKY